MKSVIEHKKQLQAFAEENPSIKQPKSELDQSLRRCAGFFTVDTAPLLCHQEHIFDNYANTSDITIDGGEVSVKFPIIIW